MTTGTDVRGATCTVHVVADSDTRWKWGASVARTLLAGTSSADVAGTVHGRLLYGRAVPNDRQVLDVAAGVRDVTRVGVRELLDELAHTEADVVVLACIGGTIQGLLQALATAWRGRPRRPVVVTGYVGLVYERMVDGLLLRAGADVLLANSAHDARRFRDTLTAAGADADAVVQTALPFLGGAPHDPAAAGRDRPFTVTFVAQPSVPVTRKERRYAVEQTLEHARRRPDRHVIVKLRGRVGEHTTHPEEHHYSGLLDGGDLPANIEFAYGSMADVLDRTDLCVTVSSTAALEAMHRGIPTAVLTDFGIREQLGNHAFLGSGAYASWPDLHLGAVPVTDPAWAAEHGVRDPAPYDALRARVADLIGAATLPPVRPWLTADTAPMYLPALLERNGLTADARPQESWVAGDPTPARRLARAGALRLYRFATDRVEPRVRKWVQV